jgi:hypothetical protein
MSENSEPSFDSIVNRLKQRTPDKEVGYLPQALHKDSVPPTALALPYIDARYVQQTLDDACGPLGWQSKVESIGGFLVVGIGIRNPQTEEWVWKWDTGQEEPSDILDSEDATDHSAGAKGVISRGFKRAGVQWGIGRDIYDLPKRRRPIKLFAGKFVGWDNSAPSGSGDATGGAAQTTGATPGNANGKAGADAASKSGSGGVSASARGTPPETRSGPTPEFERFKKLAGRLQLTQLDINLLLSGMKKETGRVDYQKAGDQLLTQLPESERGQYALDAP